MSYRARRGQDTLTTDGGEPPAGLKATASPAWLGRCATIAAVVGIGLITVVWTAGVIQSAHDQHAFGVDFAINIWQPGRAVLAGDDSYGTSALGNDDTAVYPPIASTLAVPFAPLPFEIARVVWAVVLLAALLASLRICGVRDWRCYVAACACPPVIAGVMYGNVSLLLVLAVALAWHFRDKAWAVGSLVGLVVAVKFFLAPRRMASDHAASLCVCGLDHRRSDPSRVDGGRLRGVRRLSRDRPRERSQV